MKTKLVQILNSFKILLSYVLCVFIVLLYTFFVDGTSGVLLMAFMVLVPVISIIAMVVARDNVSVALSSPYDDFKKGSNVGVVLNLTKRNAIPIPFINVTLGYSPHMCNGEDYSEEEFPQVRLTMAFEKSLEYTHSFKPSVSGKGTVYVKEAYVYDYLGFFRLKLKGVASAVDVYITPEVMEVESSQTLFNSICNSVISNDEEEENTQDTTLSVSSTLGYLHREYVIGDSPRRINWKLSCKKDRLMVRLDEPSPQTKPCIVLDMSLGDGIANPLKSIQNFEALVESSLALASMCVKHGIECTFTLCNCDCTKEYTLTSLDDIHHLAIEVSHRVANGRHALPSSISSLKTSDSMYMLFTDSFEGGLKSQVHTLREKGFSLEVVLSPRYHGIHNDPNVWVVNEDLSITPSDR